MSKKSRKSGKSNPAGAADPSEGWESLEEESEASLAPNPELEEAMREAAEAVEARHSGAPRAAGGHKGVAAEALEGAEQEIAALKDQLLRLQADFDNYRKRMLKERDEKSLYGHENLVKELLPTVDNLERAVDHARQNDGADLEGLLQGVELVLREFRAVFGRHGVVEIEAEGKAFDPAVHEAMAQADDESVAPNTVVEVYEKGYQLRDRLLRPARVVVSRGNGGTGQS